MGFIIPMWILFITQIILTAWYFGNIDQAYTQWKQDAATQEKETLEETD